MKIILASLLISSAAYAGVSNGQKAPEISLATLKGDRLSLSALKGKVVLLDFWAEWCGPCKQELPELEKLKREFAARGVEVVTVNIDKERANAERLTRELALTFAVLLDPNGSAVSAYDPPKMPSSYVIDKRGVVRFVHEGFEGKKDVERFRKELEELLK